MRTKPHFELDTLIKVNGQDVMAKVQAYCDYDDLTLDDVIGDAEDRAELERKINRGDLMIAIIWIEATALGCSGSDSLGGCYISSPQDVDQTIADYSMIANACAELERNIIDQTNTLKPFATKGA